MSPFLLDGTLHTDFRVARAAEQEHFAGLMRGSPTA